jgi:hypothetical protein
MNFKAQTKARLKAIFFNTARLRGYTIGYVPRYKYEYVTLLEAWYGKGGTS